MKNSYLLCLMLAMSITSISWATDFFVDATRPDDSGDGLSLATAKKTIQAAVNAASANDVVIVANGTYPENVTINKALTLLSTNGRSSTTIEGSLGVNNLGTILIQSDNVTVGAFGKGFTIKGFDNTDPGIESATIYVQGARSNITIRDNEIIADGEGGLITEFGIAVTNLVVNKNTFSGKTFTGATAGGCGFSGTGGQTDQFVEPNTPRQLVVIPTGSNITFTSNDITGTAGTASTMTGCTTFGQGNTLVTIDANNATIRGNTFAGTTTRFGTNLRARGTGANIVCNTFDNTGLGAACTHLVLNPTSLAGLGSPNSLAGIASQNTFNDGAYFTGALQIYRNSAQVTAIPQTPIAVNTTVLANITNINTGEKFCSIQSAINDVNTTNGHTLTVATGTYNEQILVNKSLTVKGVGSPQSVIDFTGTPTGKPTLIDISADKVTIENFKLRVDLSKLRSAVIASGAGIDTVTVKDNSVEAYGTPAGSYGDRNAVSINYGGPTNYRVATGGLNSFVFQNNTVTGTAPSSYFRAAAALDEGGGSFTGNTLQTINHDILVRFGGSTSVNISNNNLNGGGIELSDQNAGAGIFSVSNNTFDATFANTSAPGAAVLRLKNNYNSIVHNVQSNTFINFNWATSLENMNSCTLDNNTFTGPNATSRAVVFNTKSFSSNSNTIVQVPVGLTLTKNNFNGNGIALSFLNHDSDNDSYGTFTVGSSGNENNFASTLATFVALDSQTGSTNSSTFPIYPNTGGWPTTMECWATNLTVRNNKFDVGAGLQIPQSMNLSQRTSLEAKLTHKPDNSCLASLQFFLPVKNVTQNTFFATIQAAVTAAVANDVIELSEATYNEAVVIDKSLTLQGVDTDRTKQVIDGTGIALASLTGGITLASGVTGVTIKNLTVQNFTGAGGNANAGIYGLLSNSNLTITNVALQNNLSASGFYANGPVSNVSITNSAAINNGPGARGIVIWNGLKSNITITGNTVTNNACCGIELQDGNASAVNISNNTIDIGGGDNAIGTVGLNATVGANTINNNTITGGGRFGIEIKNPAGGVTVSGNNVSLTTLNSDLRDRAGIAVMRRSVGMGNIDVPNGVTITGNTVTGYQQTSDSEGFGIVIEGTNHSVTGNTVNNCDVGILQQQNPSNYPADADQNNVADQFFGRGNSPWTCGNTISNNTFSGNTLDTRNIGVGAGLVTNTNTVEYFCSIQTAINDAQTLAGHTLTVAAGTYAENVNINKALTLKGPNSAISPNGGSRVPEAIITGKVDVANDATKTIVVEGFQMQGVTTPLNYNGNGGGTVVLDVTFRKNRIVANSGQLAIITGSATNTANATIQDNFFENMSGNAMQLNAGGGGVTTAQITDNTVSGTGTAGFNLGSLTNSNVNGNTISNTAQQGIQIADASANVTIANNIITNANTSVDANRGGIRIRGTAFTGPVTITNNIVSGSLNGIIVPSGEDITGKTINVNNNKLDGNSAFSIKNVGTGTLSATCNWYGVITAATVATKISGTVTSSPWLTNGTDDQPSAIGFQPVAGSCIGSPISSGVIAGTTAICLGSSANITVTITGGVSPYTLVYSNEMSNTTVNSYVSGSNIVVTPTSSTTYTIVSITDANGTVAVSGLSGSAIVSVDPISVGGTIAGSVAVCSGINSSLMTLSGQVGAIQKWQSSLSADFMVATDIANTTTSLTATNLTATTYYRAVIKNGVCATANSSSATITIKPIPDVPTISGKNEICAEQSSTLIANGSYQSPTFNWSYGLTGQSVTVSPLTTRTYRVAVTVNGCTSDSSTVFTITVNPKPTPPTITADNMSICKGGNVVLTGGCSVGNNQFRWITPEFNANGVASLPNNNVRVITKPGVYRGLCESDKGCFSEEASITITQGMDCNGQNFITVTPEKPAICPGFSATLTASGCSGTITWTGGPGLQIGNMATFSPSATTTYLAQCSTGGSASVTVVVATANVTVANNVTTGIERVKAISTIVSDKKVGSASFTPGANVTYEAGGSVTLLPGFTAEKWSVFKAEIKGCPN